MQRKKNKITQHERQEALKNIDKLKDMMDKKENQIALFWAEIEKLADKLCKAQSAIHDAM